MATPEDTITLRSNFLTVNGNELRADVLKNSASERTTISPDELYRILILGRISILDGIESFYEQMIARNPGLTIVRPPVLTAHLGTTTQTEGRSSQVLTEKGYDNGTGIHRGTDELHDRFHEHWLAVKEAGFIPEVRQTSGKKDGGSWLALRKPTLREVTMNWFERYAPSEEEYDQLINIVTQDEGIEERKKALTRVRAMGEKAIDLSYDQPEHRSNAQITQLLVMAALKETAGDTSGSKEEVEDAATYAYNNASTPDSTVLAIENSQYYRGVVEF